MDDEGVCTLIVGSFSDVMSVSLLALSPCENRDVWLGTLSNIQQSQNLTKLHLTSTSAHVLSQPWLYIRKILLPMTEPDAKTFRCWC